MTTPHASRLRIGRHSASGQVFLITTVTDQRQPLFVEFGSARLVVNVLRDCDATQASATMAYVLMPDHLHWLFELRSGSLSKLIQRLKSISARQINRRLARSGEPVWQSGFHDRALRREEDLVDVARYIVANPVRAGLIRSLNDYPHWDAVWL